MSSLIKYSSPSAEPACNRVGLIHGQILLDSQLFPYVSLIPFLALLPSFLSPLSLLFSQFLSQPLTFLSHTFISPSLDNQFLSHLNAAGVGRPQVMFFKLNVSQRVQFDEWSQVFVTSHLPFTSSQTFSGINSGGHSVVLSPLSL